MKYLQKYGRLGNLMTYCNPIYFKNTTERSTKCCMLPFPKKGDLGIAKNYQGITLTSIMAQICSALLLNLIKPEIKKIPWKNQNGFQRNWSTTSQILIIRSILGVCGKNLKVTLLFVDFFKAFDSIHRGKIEQILLVYGFPWETVTAIMMLYKNMNVKVGSLDGNTDFFNNVAPYLFIICLDYVLLTLIDLMKENAFTLKD